MISFAVSRFFSWRAYALEVMTKKQVERVNNDIVFMKNSLKLKAKLYAQYFDALKSEKDLS